MSIKQNGGVFGRNPTFNDVTIEGDLIINGEVFTGLDFQGSWNASTNSPALASSVGTNGEFYIVSVAGTTDLNGITNWGIGDWAIFNGTVWQRVEGGADGNFNDVTVAGTLEVTGEITANGGIALGDSDKATFGAGDDLQIYSDGTDGYIDNVTGDFYIRDTAGGTLHLQAKLNEEGIVIHDDGGVDIYRNNDIKLSTTSTGIDVTGTATANDVNITDTTPNLKFTDTDGNHLANFTQSGTHLYIDNDSTGDIRFRVDGNQDRLKVNSTGIDVTGTATMDGLTVTDASSSLLSLMEDSNSGADVEYDGANNNFVISTGTGGSGSQTPRLTIQRDSGDIIFYEDTGTTAKFFWDASAESLGIGRIDPQAGIHITQDNTQLILAGAAGSNDKFMAFDVDLDADTDTQFITVDQADALAFGEKLNDNDRVIENEWMRITNAGNVGIGTDSPDYALHVATNAGFTAVFQNTAGANHRPVRWTDNTGASVGTLGADFTADEFILQAMNKPLVFGTGTNGAERMRIDSSGHAIIPAGVTLGTAAGVYSAANTLDDYEEGTPTNITCVGSTSGSATVVINSATYTKIGNLVNLYLYLTMDFSSDDIVGDIQIANLPFATANNNLQNVSIIHQTVSTTYLTLGGRVTNNLIRLQKNSSNLALVRTDCLNSSNRTLMIGASYRTNA